MTHKRQVWGKYCSWFPSQVAYPSSPEEVRDILLHAQKSRLKIRTIGSLHSMNDLCKTSDIQIHTDKLCKVINIDKQSLTIKVESGIKIKHLQELLAAEGLTLPNQGYIVEQSVAGAIATATHGSGKTGTLSSFVEEIELISAKGELHVLTPASNPHLFSAAVVSLGCLGVVSTVTLRCIPQQKLHLSKVKMSVQPLLDQLSSIREHNDFYQLVINPYSDEALTWQFRKTDEPLRHCFYYQLRRLMGKALAIFAFDILPPPTWLVPTVVKTYMTLSPFKGCVDYGYHLLSPADEGHYVEEEIAVPIAHFEKALLATRKLIDEFNVKGTRVVAIILVRFAEADAYGYLSPTLNRKTAYISLITIAKPGYQELFEAVEQALYAYEGRPHWGKVHFLNRDRVAKLYPETYPSFIAARRELDPEGVFANDYIERLF